MGDNGVQRDDFFITWYVLRNLLYTVIRSGVFWFFTINISASWCIYTFFSYVTPMSSYN